MRLERKRCWRKDSLRNDGSNEHKINDAAEVKKHSCVVRFFAIVAKVHFVFRWGKKKSSGDSDEQSGNKHRVINSSG
jgi:hypothetical protein